MTRTSRPKPRDCVAGTLVLWVFPCYTATTKHNKKTRYPFTDAGFSYGVLRVIIE